LHAVPARVAAAAPVTPIAAAPAGAPKTPLTSVLAARAPGPRFEIAISQESGDQVLSIDSDSLPFTIGRSRDQTLVIDRRHAGVSGHHIAIETIDDDEVGVIVAGDNGVVVAGIRHDAGARFAWRPGETMVLGGALPGEPPCSLVLERNPQE